jgi:hypothetical protein
MWNKVLICAISFAHILWKNAGVFIFFVDDDTDLINDNNNDDDEKLIFPIHRNVCFTYELVLLSMMLPLCVWIEVNWMWWNSYSPLMYDSDTQIISQLRGWKWIWIRGEMKLELEKRDRNLKAHFHFLHMTHNLISCIAHKKLFL